MQERLGLPPGSELPEESSLALQPSLKGTRLRRRAHRFHHGHRRYEIIGCILRQLGHRLKEARRG